jgi:branched-chain amino acid transport system ATP-binding protein
MLTAAGLRKQYGGLLAVDDVSLTVLAGQRHALIGPNGAGKSTVLALLAGSVRPDAGVVRLAGRDIGRTGPARRSRLGIARTFQAPAVFATLSVLDNVRLGAWRHGCGRDRQGRAVDCLDAVGLAGSAPHRAGSLAHGQRRLLEIAVAMAAQPSVLLLDEPAAGLADEELDRLADTIRSLPATVAVLFVEHNQELVEAVADSVTVLHQGRVLSTGSHHEVSRDPHVVRAYLGPTSGPAAARGRA